MDWQTSLLFIVVVLNAIFSLIFIRGTGDRIRVIFSLFVLSASAWSLGIGLFLINTNDSSALYLANFYYTAAAFIPLLFLYFSLIFLHDKRRIGHYYLWLSIPLVILIISFFINPHTIITSITNDGLTKNVSINLLPYSIYGSFFIGYVVSAFFALYQSLRHTSNKEGQLQLRFVIYGTIVPYALGMLFNLILPWVGNYRYVWLGPVFSLLMVASVGYAIAKHHLFNLKIITTEVLVAALWISLLIRTILSTESIDLIINILLLLAFGVLGLLLIKSVIKEVAIREKVETLAKELGVANERLTVLDRQKSEFLSIASHQLRSPLTAIKGYSSMMLEGSFGKLESKLKEAVERIFLSSERLVIIIEDFLNISRIEQGRMNYDFISVDLSELVDSAIKELEPNVKKAGLEIKFEIASKGPFYITADYGKIRQVLINIIDNAIKYTPRGMITLRLERDEETRKVLLTVTDTGIGISKESLPGLFQKFSRAPGAAAVSITGTGLGLYVVKELMKAHKGNVWVDSPGTGKGSTFYLEFMGE